MDLSRSSSSFDSCGTDSPVEIDSAASPLFGPASSFDLVSVSRATSTTADGTTTPSSRLSTFNPSEEGGPTTTTSSTAPPVLESGLMRVQVSPPPQGPTVWLRSIERRRFNSSTDGGAEKKRSAAVPVYECRWRGGGPPGGAALWHTKRALVLRGYAMQVAWFDAWVSGQPNDAASPPLPPPTLRTLGLSRPPPPAVSGPANVIVGSGGGGSRAIIDYNSLFPDTSDFLRTAFEGTGLRAHRFATIASPPTVMDRFAAVLAAAPPDALLVRAFFGTRLKHIGGICRRGLAASPPSGRIFTCLSAAMALQYSEPTSFLLGSQDIAQCHGPAALAAEHLEKASAPHQFVFVCVGVVHSLSVFSHAMLSFSADGSVVPGWLVDVSPVAAGAVAPERPSYVPLAELQRSVSAGGRPWIVTPPATSAAAVAAAPSSTTTTTCGGALAETPSNRPRSEKRTRRRRLRTAGAESADPAGAASLAADT